MVTENLQRIDRPNAGPGKMFIRRHWVIISLLLLALTFRIVYFAEIRTGPCFHQHLWEQSDMNFFHTWARQMKGGDWLTGQPLHPYHNWHDRVAERYFRFHENQPAMPSIQQLPAHVDREAKHALWDHWYGQTRYHQEPLYPYLIAAVYKLFGEQIAWIFLLQLCIGIANVFLVYDITRKSFGETAAAAAGLLAVLCGPLVFFEMVLLRSTLISFFGLFLVWLTLKSQQAESALSWGAIGLVFGLAILLKSIFILLIAPMAVYLMLRHRHIPKRALKYTSALLVGVIIALTPLLVRNISVGAAPLGLSSVTAVTFLSANAADAHPRGFFVSEHVAPIMAKTSGAIFPTAIETLKTQSTLRYAKLLGHKFLLMWHWYEIPNNANFYYYRLHSFILRYLPVTFLIIAPLGIVGVFIAIGQRRRCAPLYLLLAMHVISILLVYISARFRAPLLAALLPFAALTLTRIGEDLKTNKRISALTICLALAVVSLWTMSPLPGWVSVVRAADCAAPYDFYYRPLLSAANAEGNTALKISIYERLLQTEPASIRRLHFTSPPANESDRDTALLFSSFRKLYASALIKAGRKEDARRVIQRGNELLRIAQR